jgi:hypothetical protein
MDIRPTTQEDVRKMAKDRLWDIKAVYTLDCEKVKKWLMEHARQELGGDLNRERAIAQYPALSKDLERLYDVSEMSVDPRLMQEAQDGVFKQKAPAISGILGKLLLFIVTGGIEIFFFSFLVFYREAGGMLIGLALLLLAGGVLCGLGITEIVMHGTKSKYGIEQKIGGVYIILFIVGIALLVGITAFRWSTGGLFAGVTAAFFGLAVTTTEIAVEYSYQLRKLYLKLMFRAQEYYSARQFRKDLGSQDTHEDDTWYVTYTSFVDGAANTIKKVTR